jgi:hypothetical protein
VLVLLLILLGAAYWGVNRWIDNAGYQDWIEALLEEETGLPVDMGDMDLVLLPSLALSAEDVRIGEGEFAASMGRVSASMSWSGLLQGAVTISHITVTKPIITIPKEKATLKERIAALQTRLKSTEPEKPESASAVSVNVDRVSVNDAQVRLGAGSEALLTLSGTVIDPSGETIQIQLSGSSPKLGDSATFQGTGSITGTAFDATVAMADVNGSELTGSEAFPFGTLTAEVTASGDTMDDVRFRLAGTARPGAAGVAGNLTAEGRWFESTLAVNDVTWTGDGINAVADGTRHPNGGVAVMVREVEAKAPSLNRLLATLTDGTATAQPGGVVTGSDLYFALLPDEGFQPISGAATFAGLAISPGNDAQGIVGVHGELALVDGIVDVQRLAADGITIAGTVAPDIANERATVELRGTVEVTPDRVAPWFNDPDVGGFAGIIDIETFRGTWAADGAVPPDLAVAGTLREGRVSVTSPDFMEDFSNLSATFTADSSTLDADWTAEASSLGAVSGDIAFSYDELTLAGTARGEAVQLGEPAYWSDEGRAMLTPVFASFGSPDLAWTLRLPMKDRPGLDLVAGSADPEAFPSIQTSFVWVGKPDTGGLAFTSMSGEAHVPAETLVGVAPAVQSTGTVHVEMARASMSEAFTLAFDLEDAALKAGALVRKEVGTPASVVLTGGSEKPRWRMNTMDVAIIDETIQGRFTDQGLSFDDVDVDLAGLAPILAEGVTATGKIAGSGTTAPPSLSITVADGGVTVGPTVQFDSVAGSARYVDGLWDVRDLQIKGANSDCIITGILEDTTWRGSITGAQLDVAGVMALVEALQTMDIDGNEDNERDSYNDPFALSAKVDLGEVLYAMTTGAAPTRFSDVTALLEYDATGLHLSSIKARPYSGLLAGGVHVLDGQGDTPGQLDVDLRLDGVDMRMFDELAFDTPRNLEGSVSGTMYFTAPMTDDPPPEYGLNGQAALTATDGTLGKMGIATSVLEILRRLQIWQIQKWPDQKEGLFFETCALQLDAKDGVVTMNQFQLNNPYLTVEAVGTFDFPRQTTLAPIDVHVLEGVLRPLENIPLAGRVTKPLGTVKLEATGPPSAPEIRRVSVLGFEGMGDRLQDVTDGAVKAIETEVVDRLRKGLESLFE